MWPFRRRKRTVTVIFKIDRLDEILDRLAPKPPAPHPEAPPPKPTEHDILFGVWLGAKPRTEQERSHLRALHSIAMGRRPPTTEWTLAQARAFLAEEGAPGFGG